MSLKDLFLIFSKTDFERELKEKITLLEMNIKEIEKTISEINGESYEQTAPIGTEPPIIIEKIHIENIVLDKYELNNNFGQLGIKELKGKLNIGATYGGEFIPKAEEIKQKSCRHQQMRSKTNAKNTLKVNIRGKDTDKKD